jgi:hypothetical protein
MSRFVVLRVLVSMKTIQLACAVASVAVAACGDKDIAIGNTPEPIVENVVVETTRPLVCEGLPLSETSPVKLIVAVDTSGSMQFTDPNQQRVTALSDYIASVATDDNVSVAVIGFGATIDAEPAEGFVAASTWTPPAFLQNNDTQTDQQGMLAEIERRLADDFASTSPEERARTRYVVTLLSDGAPSPVCCDAASEQVGVRVHPSGCPLEPWENVVDTVTYCDGVEEQSVCNNADFLARFREATGDNAIPGLVAGGNYNRVDDVRARATNLHAIAAAAGVGTFDVHSTLLFDPTLADNVRAIYRLGACDLEFSAAALDEDGTAEQFLSSSAIDFSPFTVTPLCEVVAEE